jgi:creatinine amidohydrolase/Fe(II)-dependent formamide hydrolase-like protein
MHHAPRSTLLRTAAVALLLSLPAALHAQSKTPVFIDELTWTEIRDRMQAGTRSVIIGTAGQEQKGPHMVDGEHKWVLTHTTERIARALGDALVAPIVTYVPEGSWDPPRSHMTKPGTITLPEDRFVELLVHAGRSLKNGGFAQIIYIEWGGSARAMAIGDYYTKAGEDMRVMLRAKGYTDEDIGTHAGMLDTSELLYVNPKLVRKERFARNGGAPDSGVNGDPTKASAELGAELLKIKIDNALNQIRTLRAGGST